MGWIVDLNPGVPISWPTTVNRRCPLEGGRTEEATDALTRANFTRPTNTLVAVFLAA